MSMRYLPGFRRNLVAGLIVTAIGWFAVSGVRAQALSFSIQIVPGSESKAIIQGSCSATKSWSFRDEYGGAAGLGNRIKAFKAFGTDDAEINVREIAPGQFESEQAASRFNYQVMLTAPLRASDASMISWINEQRGLLMPADLLPRFPSPAVKEPVKGNGARGRATIRLDLPSGWRAFANEAQIDATRFDSADYDRTVIAIGNALRESSRSVSETTVSLIANGAWAFADADVIELATKILESYREVFGAFASPHVTLILFPLSQQSAPDKWAAETRGSTVTLLMGKLPSKTAALAQLSTPLTHELFHLWVPNGLRLDGDYDWFYEGFTIYQAARTAVRLDLLTFAEFLDAIARAFEGYRTSIDADRLSLVEASHRRWTTGQGAVYSKSLVVAFIFDLRLRSASHGKKSLDTVYRDLFRRYHSTESLSHETNVTTAITESLASALGSDDLIRKLILNPATIDLPAELAPFGLKQERFGTRSRIGVEEQLAKPQRDLLRQLGYNEATHGPHKK